MKAKLLTIGMALFVGTLVTSCDKEDDTMAEPAAGINSTSNDNPATQTDPVNAVGKMAEEMISGKYTIMKFTEGGEDRTGIFKGVTFEFSDNNVMYSYGRNFFHKGVYGADIPGRTMKMQIDGNDLMKMISGYYRITEMEEGRVLLVSDDGMKSVTFFQSRTVTPFTGPLPKIDLQRANFQ